MRTIAIINQKGGCGKTTTSINLAACLARLGQKTLLVDMDPQGHCGVGLAVPEEQIERTIYDALIEEARRARPAKMSRDRLADRQRLRPGPVEPQAGGVRAGLRRPRRPRGPADARRWSRSQGTYQWCILDCPPSVGLLTFNALRACDEVIVPVETGFFSLHGLTKMMETLEVLKEQCGKDILIRVLPTLYDTRTKLAREVLSELRAKFRDYLMESTVNFNTKLKEAASFGQPITEYDPGSRGYKDFVNLARELMGHRPVEVEPVTDEKLSRPAELVQRAKQLAQLTNFQFGRTVIPSAAPSPAPEPAASFAAAASAVPAKQEIRVFGRMPAGDLHADDAAVEPASVFRPALPAPVPPAAAPAAVKTTAQKIEEFYGVKQIGEDVDLRREVRGGQERPDRRRLQQLDAHGHPDDHRPPPRRVADRLPLRPGRYRYRLVVDGQWITDPNNSYVEANQFGELEQRRRSRLKRSPPLPAVVRFSPP